MERAVAGLLGVGAAVAVYMQFSTPAVAASEKQEGASRLKRTLTNGGLMPEPGSKMVRRASGSTAVFTEGAPALGGAESGAAN